MPVKSPPKSTVAPESLTMLNCAVPSDDHHTALTCSRLGIVSTLTKLPVLELAWPVMIFACPCTYWLDGSPPSSVLSAAAAVDFRKLDKLRLCVSASVVAGDCSCESTGDCSCEPVFTNPWLETILLSACCRL